MRRNVAVLALCAVLLVGCGTAGNRPATPADRTFEDRATQVVNAWREAATQAGYGQGLRLLDSLTVPPASGFPNDDLARQYASGAYKLQATLPADVPPAGTVKRADGTTTSVPLVSATEAFAAVHSGQPCGACLAVTGAKLGTTTVRTNQGAATVPAWLFTVAELKDPVARVAIAPAGLAPLPSPSPPVAPDALHLAQVVGVAPEQPTADPASLTRVTVSLGVGGCDKGPVPQVYETPEAVVVGGLRTIPSAGTICTDQLVVTPVPVTLSAPLGYRVLLSAASGEPVPLGLTVH
jgi:hypothetical protein